MGKTSPPNWWGKRNQICPSYHRELHGSRQATGDSCERQDLQCWQHRWAKDHQYKNRSEEGSILLSVFELSFPKQN